MPSEAAVSRNRYPPEQLVRGWLKAARFAVAGEANADDYWHLLLAAPSSMKTGSPTATYPGSTVEP
jgi:hypothetical protein